MGHWWELWSYTKQDTLRITGQEFTDYCFFGNISALNVHHCCNAAPPALSRFPNLLIDVLENMSYYFCFLGHFYLLVFNNLKNATPILLFSHLKKTNEAIIEFNYFYFFTFNSCSSSNLSAHLRREKSCVDKLQFKSGLEQPWCWDTSAGVLFLYESLSPL